MVGLNVDEVVYGLYEVAKREKFFQATSIEEDFLHSLRIAFNSKELDTEEVYEQAEFFIKLLEEG